MSSAVHKSMNKYYETSIGYRYARGKSGRAKYEKASFIGAISKIATYGIALGVMVLLTVLSVVNGFENTLKESILSLAPHATMIDPNGKLKNPQGLIEHSLVHPEVSRASAYIEDYAMLSVGEELRAVQIQGIEVEKDLANLISKRQILTGSLTGIAEKKYHIVIGQVLADKLGVAVGDKVVLLTSQGRVTPAGIMPRMRRFTIAATFEVGMNEFDSQVAFINQRDAAKLYQMGNTVTGVRLYLDDPFKAKEVVFEVGDTSRRLLYINDWTENGNLFKPVAVTKQILWIVMLLVIAVAVFNIVSTLMLVIDDKKSDIAILKTMGAKSSQIMAIFSTQGLMIAVVGTVLGVILGLLLSYNIGTLIGGVESLFGLDLLADDVYQVSDLSGKVAWSDVLIIALTTLFLAVLATLFPAWKAAQMQPAEVLRHE